MVEKRRLVSGVMAPWIMGAALMPGAAWASTDSEALKQLQQLKAEIARLEARVTAAEQRAQQAERSAPVAPPQTPTQQLRSQAVVSVDAGVPQETAPVTDVTPSSSAPGHQYNLASVQGDKITFSGDVEFNLNATSDAKQGNLVFGNSANAYGKDRNRYSQTGRVMFEVAGERSRGDNFASFRIQPLMDTSGTVNLDDAWFAFGKKDGWSARVGRYEAYDLFPTGADTFLGYSGGSSNELYSDGAGYSYQAKEGRGRASKAGQMMVSRQFGPVYFETSTVIGDRTELFANTYHGLAIDTANSKSAFIVRPLLAWQFTPSWKIAAGMETNLLNDSVVDVNGNDIGKRTGYSTTLGYSNDDLQMNFNLAHLDAYKEKDSSAGANMTWQNFGLGYIYSQNDIKSAYANGTAIAAPGKYHLDTVYASYQFSNVLDIDRFNILLGGFYSRFDAHDRDNVYGGRVRFKYFL